MKIFLFITFALITSVSIAQTRTVSGTVTDTTGAPLNNVSVNLKSATENLNIETNASGVFHFTNVSSTEFTITITSVGYQGLSKTFSVNNKDAKTFTISPIQLRIKTSELNPVIITATNPITIKEDTIEYKADAYKVREGAPVEDVIKKLPGVTVDKDGNVTAQGKQVKRVRVNGKDYFGGDVQTATQNLPANIIDNIQIIDDYGDRANITGIKEGDPEKVLNINIQKGKRRGSFGQGTVGAGTEERYLARVNANNFKDDRQIAFLGALNNTNANTFNFNGGGRGGGARGANFGSAERTNNTDGLNLLKSLGFNYRDSWGKKISSYGSYSYAGRTSTIIGTSFSQDFNPQNITTTAKSSNSHSNTNNHRLTWNLEYKIDSANYLKVSPYFSDANSSSNSTSTSQISKSHYFTLNNSSTQSSSSTPAGGTDLFYNHRFKKQGRNFSLNSSIDYSARTSNSDIQNTYHNIDSTFAAQIVSDTSQYQDIVNLNKNTTVNIRGVYSEPISKYSAVDFSYAWNQSSTKSNRDVSDVNASTGNKTPNLRQSNDYQYQFTTNRIGLSIHTFKTKYNFLVGIVAQPSNLSGKDIGRKTTTDNKQFNWAPSARFAYNFARSHSLTITYGGSSSEPSFSQLQPVIDSSNIKNIIIGNPNLKPQFTNRLSIAYNKVGILTGTSLFSNLTFDQTQNKIVNSVINNPAGTGRTTSYLNTNGFYSLSGNVAYTKPFANRKFTATVSASGNYNNNVSFTDYQRNTGNNWLITPGARFRIDIPDVIDADINGSYAINRTTTKYSSYTNSTEVRTFTYGVDGKNYFFKDWTLGYDLTKVIYSGFVSTTNTNPTLLNLYAEYRFLKNKIATIRLEGYDLFNQNTGISRQVSGTTVTDIQNNRLGRYYLLSFNLRLQKFIGGRPNQRMPGDRQYRLRDGNENGGNGSGRRFGF